MSSDSKVNISDVSDVIMVDQDDVSNYNPAQILPESPETINKVRMWLKPTTYDKNGEYQRHLGSHVPGTGDWLTSTDTYQQWLNGEDQGMLWIKGIPGSGKSVASAKIINDLSESYPGTPVLYFFFRQIIDANHQPVALLRDWLDQVLIYSPPLQKRLKELILDERRSLDSMSMEDLWKLLRMAVINLPGKVFCVADALDEMDRGNDTFLKSLSAFGQWRPEKAKVIMTSRPVPSVEAPLRKSKYLELRLEERLVDIDIANYVHYLLQETSISLSDRKIIKDAVPGHANGLFLYAKFAMDAFLVPGADVHKVLQFLPTDLNAIYTNLLREHARRSGVPDDIQLLILQWVTHATRPLRILELAEMINITYLPEKDRDRKRAKDLVQAACGPLLEILPDETVSVVHHSFTEYLRGITRSSDTNEYPILDPGPTNARLAIACLTYMETGCLDEVKIEKKPGNKDGDEYIQDILRDPEMDKEYIQMKVNYPFAKYANRNWHIHINRSFDASHDQTELNKALDTFFSSKDRMLAWIKFQWPGGLRASGNVSPLHIAARYGLTSYARKLVASRNPSSDIDEDIDKLDGRGKTPLLWAASDGHTEIVELLLDAGAYPNRGDGNGLTPLHHAASANHFQVIKVLLEVGVDPLTRKMREYPGLSYGNGPMTWGETALMYACHNGHTEAVGAFLPFLYLDAVHSALGWASQRGHSRVVAKIFQHDPLLNVNRKIRGDTALFLACGGCDYETVKCLIDAGADPNIQCIGAGDEFAGSAGLGLPYVTSYEPLAYDKEGSFKEGSFKEGSDTSRRLGVTAIHHLCRMLPQYMYRRQDQRFEDLQGIFSLLTQTGANMNQPIPDGKTALHKAAVNDPVLTRLLLDAGVDANVGAGDAGYTPLFMVQSVETMCLLIEVGHANINVRRGIDGHTPLHCFLGQENMAECILKFLEYGPDIHAVDNDGNGVLHIVTEGKKTEDEVMKDIFKPGKANPDVIKALLKAGVDPNSRNRQGKTPLHVLTVEKDCFGEIVDLMLEAGADINAPDNKGRTRLFDIVSTHPRSSDGEGSEDSHHYFTTLVSRGASLTSRDSQGRTLLHEAIKIHTKFPGILRGNLLSSRIRFLLDQGVDPHTVDYQGNNMLHEMMILWGVYQLFPANDRDFRALWDQVIAIGVDPNQRNTKGQLPLHIVTKFRPRQDKFRWREETVIDYVTAATKDVNSPDYQGITPLHLAVTISESFTKKLLDAGADPTASTDEGLTPLHLAARMRQSNIVGMLLAAIKLKFASSGTQRATDVVSHSSRLQETLSAFVNAKDRRGWTPLFYACRSGRPEAVAMLL